MDGSAPGNGLVGWYEASLQKCTADCNNNKDCNSFAYRHMENQQCKLMKDVTPTQENYSPNHDFQFCARNNNFDGLGRSVDEDEFTGK